MKYKIKRIRSRERLHKAFALMLGIAIYLLLFAISAKYKDVALPYWIFEAYKKLPK